ncbi:PKD domain-containing protein [Kitasatospora misakiensis]|uniref:PKD domain-containing protein n=1 Tax=Kitasatospora misakiensis TaxID=67330 RepID=A0ABW0XEC8_9ACTN
MRLRHALGLTVAAAIAALGLPAPATAATADTATTLHVNKFGPQCSDAGPGTYARPFCTVTAAAAVVEPGQTVRVWQAGDTGEIRIARSGTPEKPITFVGGSADTAPFTRQPVVGSPSAMNSFTLANVHDVTIRGFRTLAQQGVQVIGSSRVVVDQNRFERAGTRQVSLRVAGSDHVTVSRNSFDHSSGLVLDGGSDVLVTANDFNRTTDAGLTATGVADLAVTNNTFALNCFGGVNLLGASPRAVVKNNISVDGNEKSIQADRPYCWDIAPKAQISVSAEAAPTATVDYNVVRPKSGTGAYAWGGSVYPSPTAFAAATGQGAHDLDLDIEYSTTTHDRPFNKLTVAAAGAIDSGDPNAPGIGTDLFGQPVLDHPDVANAGAGTRDRGAHELSGMDGATHLIVTGENVPTATGPAPFTVTARVGSLNTWGTAPSASVVDFGDGSEPVTTTGTVQHTYAAQGVYTVTASAVDTLGGRAEGAASEVRVNPNFPASADLAVTYAGGPYTYRFTVSASSPWNPRNGTVDFGDGTREDVPSRNGSLVHTYATAGRYRAEFTARDESGRDQVVTRWVQVGVDPLTVLKPGERVQILGKSGSSTGDLQNGGAHYGEGVWAPFTPVGATGRQFAAGTVASVALGTTANGVAHNLAATYDGRVFIADRRMSDGSWSSWAEVTSPAGAGPLPGVPTQIAAAVIGNKLHVLALIDSRVHQATGDWSTGTWSGWGDITSAAGLADVGQIAAAATGNSLHIVGLATDGKVYIADGDYDRGTWSSGEVTALLGQNPEGYRISQVTAAAIGSKLHVIVGANTNLFQATADYAAGTWAGWVDLSSANGPTSHVTKLASAATGNKLHVFVFALGVIRSATGDYDRGAWSGWGQVSAASNAPDLSDVAVAAS